MRLLGKTNNSTNNFDSRKISVSVIFLTYNPDLQKTLRSLYALINQKGIDYEIIISDDGSKVDCFNEIENFLIGNGFSNYSFNKNKQNVGIVKNILSALEKAKGEYILFNSPGDILKYQYVLRDLYQFSSRHKARCVFTRAVYYHYNGSDYEIIEKHCDPLKPKAFNWYLPRLVGKYSLFNRYWILGAVMFRKKEYAVKYYKAIESTSRLMDDNPSALYSVMAGERIVFYDKTIEWYEAEASVSGDSKSTSLDQRAMDFKLSLQMIDEKFAQDPLYDYRRPDQNRWVRALKHPCIKACHLIFNHLPNENTPSGENLRMELNEYITEATSHINSL